MGSKIAIIVTVVFWTALLGQAWSFHASTVYPADTAMEWLWRARATNDLGNMDTYLQKSLDGLQNYHGNPAMIFPTPDTNYDLIKDNINETIATAKKIANATDVGSMAHQQAVQNLQETVKEIADHLSNADSALGINIGINPLGWALMFMACFAWLPALFIKE